MNERKINLEEIIKPYRKYLVEGVNEYKNISGDGMFVGDVLSAMKEACRQILELAAENAEIHIWQQNDDLNIVGERAKYLIEETGFKQSILNTINQIE